MSSLNVLSIKSDSLRLTFDRNTFIGFDQKEIESSNNDDLINIRKVISGYLNSTKLKKRNANFIDAYKRITKELARRKIIVNDKLSNSLNKHFSKEKEQTVFSSNSSTTQEEKEFSKNSKCSFDFQETPFLSNKRSRVYVSNFDFEIPSFFNDKGKDKNKNTDLEQISLELESQNIAALNNMLSILPQNNNNLFPFINNNNNNNNHLCQKQIPQVSCNKFLNKPVFKNDVNELEMFLSNPIEKQYDLINKELELRNAIFNEIYEDKFFVLD
jgi:hypothetical protein